MNPSEILSGQEAEAGQKPVLAPVRLPILARPKAIKLPSVVRQTGLSKTTIYGMMAKGQFPTQVPLGKRAVGWIEEEVDKWLTGRMSERKCA